MFTRKPPPHRDRPREPDIHVQLPPELKLALEAIVRLANILHRMEKIMSAEVDALNEIKTRLADLHDDVKARLDVVAGELSAEGKAEVDSIKAAFDSFDAEIGDANGSDTPETPPTDELPPPA